MHTNTDTDTDTDNYGNDNTDHHENENTDDNCDSKIIKAVCTITEYSMKHKDRISAFC